MVCNYISKTITYIPTDNNMYIFINLANYFIQRDMYCQWTGQKQNSEGHSPKSISEVQ